MHILKKQKRWYFERKLRPSWKTNTQSTKSLTSSTTLLTYTTIPLTYTFSNTIKTITNVVTTKMYNVNENEQMKQVETKMYMSTFR